MAHPDPELVVKQWMLDNGPLSSLLSTRVATSLPSNPSYPFAVVQLIRQDPVSGEAPILEAFIQVDCYGKKKDFATPSKAARTVWDEAFAVDQPPWPTGIAVTYLEDDGTSVDAWVFGFVLSSLRRLTGDTGEGRYMVDMMMTFRSA